MEFGRFVFFCALFAVAFLSLEDRIWAQQPAFPQSETAQPPVRPLSQAAIGSSGNGAQSSRFSESSASTESKDSAKDNSSFLKLGPGDLLEISVYNVPELTTKARIGNAGDIYLPLIDYVHVADLTVDEAQGMIQKRLEDGGFVRNAHVTIFLNESASQGVTILGEVSKPGVYPVLGDRKLYDFISAAGGFTTAAGRKVSVIRQRNPSAPITVNLPRNLADDSQDNIAILPGDMITVPRAPIVYVVGDVGRPAGLLVDNGNLTVLQALALAGGANHTAKMAGTRIIRKGPSGMTETRVPLKKMLEAKAPDVNLQGDDILFVPVSGARVAAGRGFEAAMAAASGLAVIAVHP